MNNVRVVIAKPYEIRYEQAPFTSAVADDEVLFRTIFSLISPGTELALYTGTHVGIPDPNNTFAKYPFYPGYATVGEVVSTGAGVSQLAPGDWVYTLGRHAAYQTASLSDQRNCPVMRLDSAHIQDAAKTTFTRLAAITLTSIVQSELRIGDVAVVIGMGLIGNLAAQLYALRGAEVVVVDVVEERLRIAQSMGIKHVILSGEQVNLRERLRELTGREAADIVVEATGSPQLVIPALQLVKHLGQVVALGSTRGNVDLNVYDYIHCKGIRFIGAHENLQDRQDFVSSRLELSRYALSLIQQNILKTEPLITHKLRYSEAHTGYDLLLNRQQQALGVLLDWRTEQERVGTWGN